MKQRILCVNLYYVCCLGVGGLEFNSVGGDASGSPYREEDQVCPKGNQALNAVIKYTRNSGRRTLRT